MMDDIIIWFDIVSSTRMTTTFQFEKTHFVNLCKLSVMETISIECQNLFVGKLRKHIINLSSAESPYRVFKV